MDTGVRKKLETFFTKFKHQIYKKGEILVRADDDPPGIFFLKSGYIKEYAISKKGDELVVNIFKPISFFPMSWAINNNQNMYFFEAVTDAEVWRAPKEKVVKFVKSNPDVLYDLLGRVFKGTDGLIMRMTYLMAGNAYARLITEMVIHTKRFGNPLHISETDLAERAGMTRETVSREMKILKEKGLVVFKKNTIVIKNLDDLEEELGLF